MFICFSFGILICKEQWEFVVRMFPMGVIQFDAPRDNIGVEKVAIGLMFLRHSITSKDGTYGYTLPDKDLYDLSMMITNRTIYYQKLDNPPTKTLLKDFQKYRLITMKKFSGTALETHISHIPLAQNFAIEKGFCVNTTMFNYQYSININYRLKKIEIKVFEKYLYEKKMRSMPSYLAGIVHAQNIKAMCNTYLVRTLKEVAQNRTYIIECPLYRNITDITIHAAYMKMSNFEFSCPKKDPHILMKFSVGPVNGRMDNHVPFNLSECGDEVLVHRPGFWLKVNDVWHYAIRKCYFPFKIQSSCFKYLKHKVNKIILMGDSHMRAKSQVLSKYFGENIKFYFTTSSVHLGDTINRTRQFFPNDATLMLNSCAWDLAFLDVSSYITGMTYLFNVLRELKSSKPRITLIWFECIAYPYASPKPRFRINSVIDGANQWVNKYMKNLCVIVHSYDISIPMEAFTQDCCHYHNLMGDKAKKKTVVNVGGVVTYLSLKYMCTIKQGNYAETHTTVSL